MFVIPAIAGIQNSDIQEEEPSNKQTQLSVVDLIPSVVLNADYHA